MVASTTIPLSKKSQEAFMEYYFAAQDMNNVSRNDFRTRLQFIDKTYQREMDFTVEQRRAQQANRSGDPNRLQNMTVPVVMPQIESAVGHQAKVFLTTEPLFPVVSSPEFITEALALETLIENDAIRGGWSRQLLMSFRDGFKYNFAPVEVTWDQEVSYAVETNIQVNPSEGVPKKVIWSGNKVTRWDPYNTFVDSRVAPSEVYEKGEFAGRTQIMSRIELKQFIAELPDKIISNIRPAFASGGNNVTASVSTSSRNYFVPDINPRVDELNYKAGGMNWMRWAGLGDSRLNPIEYKDSYELTTLYCKVLPSEFFTSVPEGNTPQIYKLFIVNHRWIIYAELQTNAHQKIPVMVMQPNEDGLDYQTKSMAEDGTVFQELASAHMNAITASRRRAISDRVLYDPSRIDHAQINSANPSAKIPVRPKAYGKPLSEAAFAFPYREDQQANSMSNIQTILHLGNQLVGQNPVDQGQFIKGNKTDGQFDTVMQNSTSRDQMTSILIEFQVLVPMKEILKINYLQYQGGTTIYNRNAQQTVEIDPIALRKAILNFRISDGLIPSDTIINTESYGAAIQAISTNPALVNAYNIGPMFSYLTKTQGADLSAFEKSPEQMAYEQALGAWQQMSALIIEKGEDPTQQLPPMPVPEQYGYVPAETTPAPEANPNQAGPATLSAVETV